MIDQDDERDDDQPTEETDYLPPTPPTGATAAQTPPPASPAPRRDYPDPIPGVLPFQTLTIFAGAPAAGKTTMALSWIRRWIDGREIWGHRGNAPLGGFYYVAADRGTTPDQFYGQLGDAYREYVTFYSVVKDRGIDADNFHKDAHGGQLLSYVISLLNPKPGAHVFLDPYAPAFVTGNQNRTRDVMASLVKTSRICEERQINITCMWHFGKQKADKNDRYKRPMDRISGNSAVIGFSDTQIWLVDPEPPKIPYHVLGWNPRYSAPEEFRCTREGRTFTPYRGLDDVGTSPAETENLSTEGRLHKLMLALGPLAAEELCNEAVAKLEISRRTFYRCIKALKMDGRIDVLDDLRLQAKPLN